MIRLCEHPKQYQIPVKALCPYAGFSTCQKYKQPIKENAEGWRVCCNECKIPFYIEGESQ